MKKIALIAASLLFCVNIHAQQRFDFSVGEYFLGLSSGYGYKMPIGDRVFSITPETGTKGNLVSPLMVSTTGRYVFANSPLVVKSVRGAMVIPNGCEIVTAGNTLRKAFLSAISKHMKPDGKMPPEEFFNAPVYNTWTALGADLSEETIKAYVDGFLSHGFKPGIFVIDNGWQSHNGSYEFEPVRFPNPAALVSYLHNKGFKVLLQLTPMVSPDCLDFKKLKNEGRLEQVDSTSLPKIVEWYGGYSAVIDMSKPENIEYVSGRLKDLTAKYGIDGFKFDYVVNDSYKSSADYYDHIAPWTKLASEYKYHIILGAYKSSGESLMGQLLYRKPVWNSLPLMVAEAINAGITGYPFFVPDPVGGGFVLSDSTEVIDSHCFIRMAQMQAFFPTMQFSVPAGNKLTADEKRIVKEAVTLHEELLPYIKELAANAAVTGEPIIHSMEYNFPGKGFYDCNDQFMLGSRYLIAPVMKPDGSRNVRLPAGVWIDDAGKRHKGPAVINLKVPIERNLYFRAAKDIKTN